MEVYAGFYAADNGASGEGSPSGSFNENKFFNGYPDEVSENMKLIDVLGGPDTCEHYPTGLAAATSAPFKMFKRYSQFSGGTCDPLVVTREKGGQHGESIGKTKLYVNDKVVAQGPMKTQPGKFTLSGDGLCIGMDSGDAVSQEYID
jgi:arylsulfatase